MYIQNSLFIEYINFCLILIEFVNEKFIYVRI